MTYKTYQEAREAAVAYFQEGKFAAAMEIFETIRSQFPDDRIDIDYFRSCLAVRLNKPALTYDILDEFLAQGIWLSEDLFRLSPSYKPLQEEAEFKQRLAAHKALRAQSGDADASDLHTCVPAGVDGPLPLIFHLHGNGSTALAEIENWQTAVDLGWLVAAPHSANVFWASGDAFWPDHETARVQMVRHLADLRADFEIDTETIIFSGFSMGGDVALAEVLKGELAPACGFLMIAPGGPMMDEPKSFKPLIETAKARSLRGAIIMSDLDAAIQGDKIAEVAELLNAGGIPTRFEKYPDIGHVFPSDFGERINDLLVWITKNE